MRRSAWPLLALLSLLSGCQQLIGLKTRDFAPGDAGPIESSLCDQYCKDVNANCDDPRFDAFTSVDDCKALCRYLPAGSSTPSSDSADTVSCRASRAKEAGSVERDTDFCPGAAPGGGSPGTSNSCGDNCDAYCSLYATICPDTVQDDCVGKCGVLRDRGSFSAKKDYTDPDDTVQCRLAHLTAAAVAKAAATSGTPSERQAEESQRQLHCMHSAIKPPLDGQTEYCDLPANTDPTCDDYCRIIMYACANHRVYDTPEQCQAVCSAGFPASDPTVTVDADSTTNTLACRRWHTYFALSDDPKTHCPHAGPSGDGHCGASVCATYCSMLSRACGTQYSDKFGSDDAACESSCNQLTGMKALDVGYDLGDESIGTNTFQCRMHHLAEAFSDPSQCDHAFPGGTCSP